MLKGPVTHPVDLADLGNRPRSLNFDSARQAFDYLEGRGYRLTKSSNWLPPNAIDRPTHQDVEAAMLLGVAGYGGIIRLKVCPFCGGRADPYSNIGVECLDCGAAATDVAAWQKRV